MDYSKNSKFIESYLIEDFLYKYYLETGQYSNIQYVCKHFLNQQCWKEEIVTFPSAKDWIMTDDEVFQRHIDLIPVNIEAASLCEFDHINYNDIQSLEYDCYISKHLNYLIDNTHKHNYFEICYVWSGSCVQNIGGKECTLVEGDLFFIPPDLPHSILSNDTNNIIINIMISRTAFDSSIMGMLSKTPALFSYFKNNLYGKNSDSLHFHTDNSKFLKRIIKHMFIQCYYSNNSLIMDCTSAILMSLLQYIILNDTTVSKGLGHSEDILNILQLIQKEYQHITLKEAANMLHYTESSLSRRIKKATEMTFSEHLLQIRMRKASDYLKRTDIPVGDICEMVGYLDPTHFIRVFKSHHGVTPHVFRKQF